MSLVAVLMGEWIKLLIQPGEIQVSACAWWQMTLTQGPFPREAHKSRYAAAVVNHLIPTLIINSLVFPSVQILDNSAQQEKQSTG